MSANEMQVGGDHYKKTGAVQHWDLVHIYKLDYLLGCATKYLSRWPLKGTPVQDARKAKHFFEKWLELGGLRDCCEIPESQSTMLREWVWDDIAPMVAEAAPWDKAATPDLLVALFTMSPPDGRLLSHFELVIDSAEEFVRRKEA